MKFEVVNNFSEIPPLVEDLDSNPSWPILKISAFPGHRFSCKQTGDGGVDQALGTRFFLPAQEMSLGDPQSLSGLRAWKGLTRLRTSIPWPHHNPRNLPAQEAAAHKGPTTPWQGAGSRRKPRVSDVHSQHLTALLTTPARGEGGSRLPGNDARPLSVGCRPLE